MSSPLSVVSVCDSSGFIIYSIPDPEIIANLCELALKQCRPFPSWVMELPQPYEFVVCNILSRRGWTWYASVDTIIGHRS